MASITNVSFPEEKHSYLREAAEYYRFENLSAFFRTCGHILIEHYEQGDSLAAPLHFVTNGKKSKGSK
jgi:hypothetical protein